MSAMSAVTIGFQDDTQQKQQSQGGGGGGGDSHLKGAGMLVGNFVLNP